MYVYALVKNLTYLLFICIKTSIINIVNMPNKPRDHFSSRKLICVCCGDKNLKCIELVTGNPLLILIQLYANTNYNMTLYSNPIGLCPTCKIYLYSAKKGETLSLVTLERWLLTSERIKLLPRFKGETVSTCDCLLCIMSRDKSKSINLQDVLNMYINDPEVPKEVIDKICCTCYQRIGSGIQHPCNKRDIVQNLKTLLMLTGLKTVEQVLSKSLKEIQQFKNIELDNTITLSTGGTPLSLQIGKKPTLSLPKLSIISKESMICQTVLLIQ
ncbi:uncharacterized protein LOC105844563 isoform X1 [Hydra vulgaris]|uniref:uncharacterized protein LOC105844563 isoform X1 n=1 Tax=Hydra vulgaris TaxID=6087 RepID=UPI001F5EA562|nr:uncharacterized protein LOC105844563 [Hydra vulgaris]